MTIDIAICTWNRSVLLEQTLTFLLELRVPADIRWSVLVINNGSTDDTVDVVRRFESRLPLRLVLEPTPGLAHARNRAITETSGEVLAFTDDDVIVDQGWLDAIARAFREHSGVAVIGGHIEAFFSDEPPPDLMRAFPELAMGFCSIDHGADPKLLGADEHVFGANMAFRRSAIADLRFDTGLGMRPNSPGQGEELELIGQIRANGGSVLWWPTARVKHFVAPERASEAYLSGYMKAKGATRC